ncbi:MAG: HEAT repeat domain-containing protein [Deltaproteobacteria bacterium]|nr:HEAT repeat domain-containing protein [Deltaproteobacteria bacterium]
MLARWLVIPFALIAAEVTPAESVNPLVEFSKGRLTVRAVEVSLNDLLGEIGKRIGIAVEIRDQEAEEKRVTLNLVNLSPSQAFEEILRGLSFAFFYDDGRLAHVVALPAASASESSPSQLSLSTSSPRPSPRGFKPTRSEPGPDFEQLLKRSRDEGMKALSQALASPDSDVKSSALEVLTEQEGPDVIPILSGALRDPDPEFRMEVLEALADKREFHTLRSALSDQSREVRERAAELLEVEREEREKEPEIGSAEFH